MEINRRKYDTFREDELIYFCEGAGKSEMVVNLTYFAKLCAGIRVKIGYDHNAYNNREVGLIITIINSSTGYTMDEMYMRFDNVIGNQSHSNLAQIGGDGWAMDITDGQRAIIRKAVQDYTSFWSS